MAFFSWLATLIGLVGGIFSLFYYMDKTASPSVKHRALCWLDSSIPLRLREHWPAIYLDIFDGVFGPRLWSIRFVGTSAITFLTCALLLVLGWSALYPNEAEEYFANPLYSLVVFGVVLLVTNLIPDYLSNCQTRFIVGNLARSLNTKEPRATFVAYLKWIALDLLLTATLSAAIVIPVSIYFSELLQTLYEPFFGSSKLQNGFDVLKFLTMHASEIQVDVADDAFSGHYKHFTPPYGVLMYTTFCTSIWLWLYSLTGIVVRFLLYFLGPTGRIVRLFNFEAHLLLSHGGVCGILVGVVYVIVSAFLYFL